jgi:hypothetical protein
MFSRICNRLTYANVAATLALFFAMSGGALAAGHYLITSTKQLSPKVIKSLKGADGKNGTAGANGATGAQGPTGPAGSKGEPGAGGANGAPGTSVTSVESPKEPIGPCKKGGSEFKSASPAPTYACNGEPAKGGGVPPILPAGKSEKGTWAAQTSSSAGLGPSPISFTIPLAGALNVEGCEEEPATRKKPCQVHYINTSNKEVTYVGLGNHVETEDSGVCKEGRATAPKTEETPEPNLCVYGSLEIEAEFRGAFLSTPAGPVLIFKGSATEDFAYGSWAVTAGEEG